jgi:hypothetical protein
MQVTEQGNKATVVFQTGLTGSTGCVLSYDRVHSVMPGFGIDKRKAQPQKSLKSEEIIRTGTRISLIGRIYTDPGARRLEKAPEHGEVMIVSPSNINKPQMNADKRRFVIRASVIFEFFFNEQSEGYENHSN